MNPPKCDDLDYIHFLIASVGVFTRTEAARCQPEGDNSPSRIQLQKGFLIIDDTILDKPYAKNMSLVYHQWSGKHHQLVNGINICTLLWTDGNAIIPVDFRIYDIDVDGKTKNDHFREMLYQARDRDFQPRIVLFDSWYASIENLKTLRKFGWHWLTRLKKNRLVNPDKTKNLQIHEIDIPSVGRVVHLKAYGFIKVFRIVSKDGDIEYWATDLLDMDEPERVKLGLISWNIEEYHRGIKQFCGIENRQARKSQSQKAHILFSLRAFLRLEVERLRKGITWFESKRKIMRNAVRLYIQAPTYLLQLDPTA